MLFVFVLFSSSSFPFEKRRRLIRVCKLQRNRPTAVSKGKNASISCSDLFTYCTVKQQEAGCTTEIVCQRLRAQQVLLPSDTEGTDGWIDGWTVGRTYKRIDGKLAGAAVDQTQVQHAKQNHRRFFYWKEITPTINAESGQAKKPT